MFCGLLKLNHNKGGGGFKCIEEAAATILESLLSNIPKPEVWEGFPIWSTDQHPCTHIGIQELLEIRQTRA